MIEAVWDEGFKKCYKKRIRKNIQLKNKFWKKMELFLSNLEIEIWKDGMDKQVCPCHPYVPRKPMDKEKLVAVPERSLWRLPEGDSDYSLRRALIKIFHK